MSKPQLWIYIAILQALIGLRIFFHVESPAWHGWIFVAVSLVSVGIALYERKEASAGAMTK